jgi:hypothetical protein
MLHTKYKLRDQQVFLLTLYLHARSQGRVQASSYTCSCNCKCATAWVQVETASESSSPRSAASDDQWVGRPAPGQQLVPGKEAGAKAAPAWLTDWRIKLALSSKVHRTAPRHQQGLLPLYGVIRGPNQPPCPTSLDNRFLFKPRLAHRMFCAEL